MKIALASDHRGYHLKQELIEALKEKCEILDLGTNSEESVDFPEFGILVGETVKNKEADLGIAICGTGIGISIAANKVKGVIYMWNNKSEVTQLFGYIGNVFCIDINVLIDNNYIDEDTVTVQGNSILSKTIKVTYQDNNNSKYEIVKECKRVNNNWTGNIKWSCTCYNFFNWLDFIGYLW